MADVARKGVEGALFGRKVATVTVGCSRMRRAGRVSEPERKQPRRGEGGAEGERWRLPGSAAVDGVAVTALQALLFSSGISISSTYENCGVRHFLRTDTTFDNVQSRTSMEAYLYHMLVQASLLARDARYIAHARTQTHRTRITATSTAFFFACALHTYSSSFGHLKLARP